MDVKEYSYILTIVKCGSISEAAKELFISQPSLSQYMINLEHRAGMKLFYKEKGKLYLTQEGKRYVEYARKIVDLDRGLMRELENMRSLESGEVILGVTRTRGSLLIPDIWVRFHEKYPGITLKVVEATSLELEELYQRHKLDMAVISQPVSHLEAEYDILYRDRIVVTLQKQDPVCRMAKISENGDPWIDIRELKEHPFILLKKGRKLRDSAEELFSRAGISPDIVCETDSPITAYRLSGLGMGCNIITDNFCKRNPSNNLSYFLVGEPVIEKNVVVAHYPVEYMSLSAKALLEIVKEVRYSI